MQTDHPEPFSIPLRGDLNQWENTIPTGKEKKTGFRRHLHICLDHTLNDLSSMVLFWPKIYISSMGQGLYICIHESRLGLNLTELVYVGWRWGQSLETLYARMTQPHVRSEMDFLKVDGGEGVWKCLADLGSVDPTGNYLGGIFLKTDI